MKSVHTMQVHRTDEEQKIYFHSVYYCYLTTSLM